MMSTQLNPNEYAALKERPVVSMIGNLNYENRQLSNITAQSSY